MNTSVHRSAASARTSPRTPGAPLLVLSAAIFAPAAAAQVERYDIFKLAHYTQTSDALVQSPATAFQAFAYLKTFDDTDASSVSLSGPAGVTPPAFTLTSAGNWDANFRAFAAEQDLEAALPPGAYLFAISGGTLGSQAAGLSLPAPAYPQTPPFITSDGFSRLQNMDPAQEFQFTIAPLTPTAPSNDSSVSITIADRCTGEIPYVDADPGSTTISLPAGMLKPAHNYVLSLNFTDIVATNNAGFGAATARAWFINLTRIEFAAGYDGCLADLDHQNGTTLEDFFAFFNAFDTGQPPADLDGCNGVDLDDFFLFFNAWDQPCPG
jgi:hypothetical protein